jgi:hypothetical protein
MIYECCETTCESPNYLKRGYLGVASRWKQRYSCTKCGRWYTGNKTHKVKPL